MSERGCTVRAASAATAPRTQDTLSVTPRQRRSRAARLIEQIIGTGVLSPAELAVAVVVDEATLDAYRLSQMKMPLERQLCLAVVTIEHVPVARRAGFALRAQVEAQLAVAATLTETHDQPPVSHRWP